MFVGHGRVNRRQNKCKTFVFRVASLIGCKRGGSILMHTGGNRRLSVVPLINSFGFCKKVCQSMRLLVASRAYVSPLSCTSPKICLMRRIIDPRRTGMYTGIGLSGHTTSKATRLRILMASNAGIVYGRDHGISLGRKTSVRRRLPLLVRGPHL